MSRARDIANLIGGATPDIVLKTATGAVLNLQTSDTTVTASSVLGEINFQAPDEASGTDAILVAANIEAVAEDTFDSSTNATKLVFKTGASAAADSKFEIASDGSLSTPTLGTSNVRFGVNAGNSIASGGNFNTVVGDEAGTAISTGDLHTFIGYGAGDAVSTESTGLTAIGANALTSNTSGTDNVAVGTNALEDCTQGIGNVAVGRFAAADIIDADGNVAIGGFDGTVQPAMRLNTKSHDNVAIGAGALAAHNLTNNSSGYNTAVGYSAGLSVTTGIRNTLIGGLAGDSLTDADFNVALGYGSLRGDTLGSTSTAIGYNALRVQNFTTATNTYNVAVGYNAGTAVSTGTSNLMLGALAGDALTGASHNTVVGTAALTTDTLGSKNTAIGKNVLASQNFTTATDAHNTAIGHEAGLNATTGKFNTFLGSVSAGNGVVTGTHNTGLGMETLYALTSGTDNVIIGYQSGAKITTGAHNVAVGREALETEDTGSASTAIGHLSLRVQNNDALNHNVGVGYQSGVAVTSGTGNTFIGSFAGHNCTTGNNNTVVGFDCGLNASDTAQVIVLGKSVTSQAANNFTFGFTTTDSNIAFGATSITAPSDERYKEDIADSTAGLSFIKDLRPVTFKWKKAKDVPSDHKSYIADGEEGSDERVMQRGDKIQHGFIAQEVKTAIDNHSEIKDGFDMWSADPTDGRQRLGPTALIPMFVKAIQELSAEVETLKTKVAALEAE